MSRAEIAITGTVVPALPADPAGRLLEATAGWLADQESVHTHDAYKRDVLGLKPDGRPSGMRTPAWLPWCSSRGLDPLAVRPGDVSAYARVLEADGASPGTRARKLSAVSSWYDYLIADELTERNPAKKAGRPRIDRDVSPATGLSVAEIDRLLDQAAADSPRALALISLLYFNAFRVGSVLAADTGQLGWDQGDRCVTLKVKGGGEARVVLEAAAADALDAYLAARGEVAPGTPLFATRTGKRLLEQDAWRLIRRLARQAGIKSWAKLNPHSLRHTHITHARDAGVSLEVVQQTAMHKDWRTTLRYDRARTLRRKRSGTKLSERRRLGKADFSELTDD